MTLKIEITTSYSQKKNALKISTSLLFIPQTIYENGELWWDDINKGKLRIRSPWFSGCPTRSHLVENQEKLAKEMKNSVLKIIFVHQMDFYML
jgi:hypothetical protein